MAEELADTEDLLGCSAALALLGDFAGGSNAGDLTGGSPGGVAALLAEVSQQLDALLGHPELLLRCQALRVRASLACLHLSLQRVLLGGSTRCSCNRHCPCAHQPCVLI